MQKRLLADKKEKVTLEDKEKRRKDFNEKRDEYEQ
jgi:hypothetical protein